MPPVQASPQLVISTSSKLKLLKILFFMFLCPVWYGFSATLEQATLASDEYCQCQGVYSALTAALDGRR